MTAATVTGRRRRTLLVLAPLRVEARALRPASPAPGWSRAGVGLRRAAGTARSLHAGQPAGGGRRGRRGRRPSSTSWRRARSWSPTGSSTSTATGAAPAWTRRRSWRRPCGAGAWRSPSGPSCQPAALVKGPSERARLAATGALAVDMETSALLGGAMGSAGHGRTRHLRHLRPGACCPPPSSRGLAGPARPARRRPGARGVGRSRRPEDGPAGRTAVVLRRRGAGHPDGGSGPSLGSARPSTSAARSSTTGTSSPTCEPAGAVFVHELDEVPDGATVVFSAHGVAPSVRAEAAGPRTCGWSTPPARWSAKVHHEVHRFQPRGYQVVLIGHAGHDETEGTLGEARGDHPGRATPTTSPPSTSPTRPSGLRDPDHPLPRRCGRPGRAPCPSASRRSSGRTPPTCVTPPKTARTRCGPSRRRATWCWSSGSANSSNSARLVEVATAGRVPRRPARGRIRAATRTGCAAPRPSA